MAKKKNPGERRMIDVTFRIPKDKWSELKLLAIQNDICPYDIPNKILSLFHKVLLHQLNDKVIVIAEHIKDGHGRNVLIIDKTIFIGGSRPGPNKKKGSP